MAMDQRDYWIEKERRRSGYVERARFRMSEADIERKRRARVWRIWALVPTVFLLCAWALGKFLRS